MRLYTCRKTQHCAYAVRKRSARTHQYSGMRYFYIGSAIKRRRRRNKAEQAPTGKTCCCSHFRGAPLQGRQWADAGPAPRRPPRQPSPRAPSRRSGPRLLPTQQAGRPRKVPQPAGGGRGRSPQQAAVGPGLREAAPAAAARSFRFPTWLPSARPGPAAAPHRRAGSGAPTQRGRLREEAPARPAPLPPLARPAARRRGAIGSPRRRGHLLSSSWAAAAAAAMLPTREGGEAARDETRRSRPAPAAPRLPPLSAARGSAQAQGWLPAPAGSLPFPPLLLLCGSLRRRPPRGTAGPGGARPPVTAVLYLERAEPSSPPPAPAAHTHRPAGAAPARRGATPRPSPRHPPPPAAPGGCHGGGRQTDPSPR